MAKGQKWNPNDCPDDGQPTGDYLDEAGDYWLCFTKILKRDESEGGTPFVRLGVKVLIGPHEGQIFSERVFLTPAALQKRFARFCHALRYEGDGFDPFDNRELFDAVCGRPFKATVKIPPKRRGQSKQYAELEWPIKEAWSKKAIVWADKFIADFKLAVEADPPDFSKVGGSYDENDFKDGQGEDDFSGSSGGHSSGHDEDDIPF